MMATICDDCADRRESREPVELREERRKLQWDQRVGSYFSIFDPNRLPAVMLPHFEDVLAWHPDNPKGIGFIGKSRTAKSKVLFELGRRLYIRGQDVYPTSGIEFAEKVQAQVNDRGEFEQYIHRVKNCKILILDDADKCRFTEAVEAAYYGMLETRRRFQRPVLASVNINGKQMAASATENRGEPIVNRLRDLCEIIELK